MHYRRFGRTDWMVSEIGYGMWGMGGWSGSEDAESLASLQLAVDSGCNFFDTAWAYGDGHSERLLREILRSNPDKKLYTATKIPPKNNIWPSKREFTLDDCYPPDHIDDYIHRSVENLKVDCIDLIQFHTWEDNWLEDDRWWRKISDIRQEGIIKAVGISLNRWEPWNGVKAVNSGLIDAVQVIYNIFDQNPEDELFPACRAMDVGIIARVPFDEGTLTGNLTLQSKWPKGDWRNTYFNPENLKASVEHAEQLKPLIPQGMSMPELALRFILTNQDVSTIIPGMRKMRYVKENIATSEAGALPEDLHTALRALRWVRTPTPWSQ